MGTRVPPPPGLDYVPVPGEDPNLVFGVIRATLAGETNTASGAVLRRLFPVAKPAEPQRPWPKPSCYRHDVLLPAWSPTDYIDPQVLCRAYDEQAWDGIKDLVIIMNFRFPECVGTPSEPPSMALSAAYELVRSYCCEKLVGRGLATVLAMHLPSRAGITFSPPHVHSMSLCRVLAGVQGYSEFTPLARDSGRKTLEREWLDHCRQKDCAGS